MNPADAISLLQEESPYIVLVDIDRMDSETPASIRSIRAAAPDAALIATTIDDYQIQRSAAREAGASAYVRKWMMDEELLPLLESLLPARSIKDQKKTVLCIDDQLEMISLIELILDRGRFEVVGALDGQQGLDIVRSVKPDVILLNLMMPGMDGWEVVRRLRADGTLQEVPLIAVTVVYPDDHPYKQTQLTDCVAPS